MLGIFQFSKLDCAVEAYNIDRRYFIEQLNRDTFFIDFKMQRTSNYAINLIRLDADLDYSAKRTNHIKINVIEFCRGSAGGDNQLRQPCLKDHSSFGQYYIEFPVTEQIDFFAIISANFLN